MDFDVEFSLFSLFCNFIFVISFFFISFGKSGSQDRDIFSSSIVNYVFLLSHDFVLFFKLILWKKVDLRQDLCVIDNCKKLMLLLGFRLGFLSGNYSTFIEIR